MRTPIFAILILLVSFLTGCSSSQSNRTYGSGYTSAYTIVIDGFSSRDIGAIEEELMSLNGYYKHRISMTSYTHTEYWYQSDLGSAALDRAIHNMLNDLGLAGVVQFSGNTFTLNAISGRGQRRSATGIDKEEW